MTVNYITSLNIPYMARNEGLCDSPLLEVFSLREGNILRGASFLGTRVRGPRARGLEFSE